MKVLVFPIRSNQNTTVKAVALGTTLTAVGASYDDAVYNLQCEVVKVMVSDDPDPWAGLRADPDPHLLETWAGGRPTIYCKAQFCVRGVAIHMPTLNVRVPS